MSNEADRELSHRGWWGLNVGVALVVGLVIGAANVVLTATGWEDSALSTSQAFILGFLVGVVFSLASSALTRRRRRKQTRHGS